MEKSYSGKTLPEKLGVREGQSRLLLGAPEGYPIEGGGEAPYDWTQSFVASRLELELGFSALVAGLKPDGQLWISWPKRSSGVPSDLDENVVRGIGLEGGLVDVKVVSVDEIWSGLKFVYRLQDRG